MHSFEAPIALFVYNRLDHTQRTVAALAKNIGAEKTDLIVFCDGPKENATQEKVLAVREYVKNIQGFRSVQVFESPTNKGLATSIIEGVTTVIDKFGKVIVMEDDLVTSPYFLSFMNDGLQKYKDNENVISIHGYVLPTNRELPETFFIRGADCWGWATWARGWNFFEANGQKLLTELHKQHLTKEFNFNNSYAYTKMLEDQVAGKISSWAIRWNASAFLQNKLTLYPGISLVENIGTDGSGTNCAPTDEFQGAISTSRVQLKTIEIEESKIARAAFEEYFRSLKPTFFSRIKRKLTRLVIK